MLDIQLDKEYKLTSDSMNYILSKKSLTPNEKTGEYTWTGIKFYSTITGVLQGYKELTIRTSDCTTINEVLEVSNGIDTLINSVLKGI